MLKLALKDLKLFFSDRRSVLLTFAIPIALITLFAFAFGGVGSSSTQKKVSLLIADLDQTPASQKAIHILDTLKSIQLTKSTLAKAQAAIKKGDAGCVLIIHQGFSDSLQAGKHLPLELQYDAAKKIEVGLLQQALIPTVIMLPYSLGNPKKAMLTQFFGLMQTNDKRLKQRVRSQSDNLFASLSQGIQERGKTDMGAEFFQNDITMTALLSAEDNHANLGLIQAVAGTSIMMLLFAVVAIGMGLLDEKQEGTLKRLLYTPISPRDILWGKMISANVISIIQLLIMFLFAALAFGLNIFNRPLALLLIIIATAYACSAFGVFIAAMAKTRSQVQGLSTLIILVMSAIGGSMVPLFLMPDIMQKLAMFSVNYWSIQGVYDIFWRHLPLLSATFLWRLGVLLLIGTLLNVLAVLKFKKNILSLT